MKTIVMRITPKDAERILTGNTGNRNVRVAQVASLANTIMNGGWVTTHQGIAISKSGKVLDGQHRLMAIIKSGIAVEIAVTTDVDDMAFRAIDTGITRNMRDIFGGDSRVIETIRLAASLHTGNAKVSADFFEPYYRSHLFNLATDLITHTGKTTKRFTTAGNKLGTILATYTNLDTDYAFSQYRACALLDFDRMSRYVKSYFKYVSENGYSGSGSPDAGKAQINSVIFSMKAFDEERKDLIQFRVLPSERASFTELAVGLIGEIFEKNIQEEQI